MRKRALMVAVGLLVVSLPGCLPGKWTGGGMMTGNYGDLAQFALTANAKDTTGDGQADDVKGQLEFHHPAYNVSLHGVITSGGDLQTTIPTFWDGQLYTSEPGGGFVGTYSPQPSSLGDGGTFQVAVFPFAADTHVPALVIVELQGGLYDGYFDSFELEDGNISYHP